MKEKCQVFTPSDYVKKLLDTAGYTHNLFGKKIMENSCGDGNILTIVIQRYIDDCLSKGISRTRIKSGLSKDVYGVEIDPVQHKKCIEKLNRILKSNDISPVEWNITNEDFLKTSEEMTYDFIVGNPPYITYSELGKDDQEYLRSNFSSCRKGKFDYCYAFLEKSMNLISDNGRMSYLIPSSVFKTVFGESIRSIMRRYVVEIYDYSQVKLFKEALVKSSIVVLENALHNESIHYEDETTGTDVIIGRSLLESKWFFHERNVGDRRFGDYFQVSNVVATLYNDAFILKRWGLHEDGSYICGDYILENDLVRETASPKTKRNFKEEKIIFPYTYDDHHRLIHYNENEMKTRFPGVFSYLRQYIIQLENRDSDKASLWFEYGRSQALQHLDCEKALISTIISKEVPIYRLNQECIPYAGLYIIAKSEGYSVEDAINILRQEEFLRYVRNVGIPINGSSVRITAKDIEDYLF